MKKITSAIAVVCLGISTLTAQTQRTILYEEFTGENCGPCASTNPGLTNLIHSPGNFPDKIVLVRYQCNIPSAPGPGSLYQDNPTEVATRQSYYSVPFAPYARFNGIVLPDPSGSNNGHAALLTQTYINDSATTNAPFSLGIVYGFNATLDSVTVTATITAAQNFTSGSLVLHMAMEEAAIHFTTAPGSNGEKDFYDVMRKMVPNASGTALSTTNWTSGQTQVVTLKAPIPTYIKNKNQICFVGWIQDVASKRVHQSGYGKLNVDMGALSLGASASCLTTFAPSITVKNCGTNPVTSYSLTYSIDGGTPATIAGTGTPLAAGATTNVMLPSGTYAVGTHTVTASTSMPNGSADMFAGNDAMATQFFYVAPSTIVSAPVVEGFQGGTFPPANWGVINGGDPTYTWISGNYGGFQASTKCAYMDLWDAPNGDVDEMVLAPINLSGFTTAQMSFDIAKGLIPGQADRMKIVASSDCGSTWVTLYDKDDNTGLSTTTYSTAAYFPAASTEWRTDNVTMNSMAGNAEVLVKFITISAYSQNIFIDNINLQGAVGIKSITKAMANVSVYPNPATSEVNLTVSLNHAQMVNVNIYNSMGELVYSDKKNMSAGDNNMALSTAALSNGMYTVRVATQDEFASKKLTITK